MTSSRSIFLFTAALAVLAPPALAQSRELSAAPSPAAFPGGGAAPSSKEEAHRLSDAFAQVAERASASVVQIDVTARDESQDHVARWFGNSRSGDTPVARGTGSGVVFSADGAILTNNHVVDEALSINVRLRDGRLLPGRLVGRDPATDLAVLKVDAQGLTPARFADSEVARVGEWVVAIGSPFGLGYTVTTGVLSAKGRGGIGMNVIEDYLQTDASINPGNSGGPLCDLEGRVLGINTMIVGRASGIGFAVPANMARRVAEQILKNGKVQRAWLGVGIQDLNPELGAALKLDPRAGALVNSVDEGGPAFKSNVRPGDVVAAVAGRPVRDSQELVREVLTHDVGQAVQLEIVRDGKRYATPVTLAAKPEAPVPPTPMQQPSPRQEGLGLGLRDLTPAQSSQAGLGGRSMAVVGSVVPGSPADRAGLRPGDLVVEADGVLDPSSVQVQQAAADGLLLLRVKRKGSAFYAALRR